MLFTEPVWPSCVLSVLWNLARVKKWKFIYFFKRENENECHIVDDGRHVPLPNSAWNVKLGVALDVRNEVETGLFSM